MSHGDAPVIGGISRRNVLRAGVASAAAFTIGPGTAAAGHGTTGGSLLVVGEPLVGEPFTAVPAGVEFAIPASCQASESELRDYDILFVTYLNGSEPQLAAVLREEPHFDDTGETAYEFTSVQSCQEPDVPGVQRGSFRPLRPGRP